MAYITNPVYLGVGSVDAADRTAMFRKETWLRENHKQAYATLAQMSPAQINALVQQINAKVAALPRAEQERVKALGKMLTHLDLRTTTGLGQNPVGAAVQAADWSTKLANIAGTIAALTTLTLGVVTFVDTRKASKEQKETQDRQEAAAAKQASEEIAARKQMLADSKRAADAAEAGVTLDAQGNPIPKKAASPLSTIATLAAAAGGAFLITK
jgi:hypothetical protein